MQQMILIVPGSLRSNSSSHKLIPVISKYFPRNFTYQVFDGTGELPHFNDADEPSDEVVNWRKTIAGSVAVVFITPEYAYGVPGTLKNALDWIVSSGDLVNKPTVLITAATGGEHAHQSLLAILGALTAKPAPGCELLISFIRSKLDDKGNITDPQLEVRLADVVDSLISDINLRQQNQAH
ncbi:MAG: NAD(P)H-dependent oxidoreductase [Chitinophagaceae bacterium]|nr:MAG: NAD(P)H-dependent oxidoreductase [Chitinophagaceae bacterium]